LKGDARIKCETMKFITVDQQEKIKGNERMLPEGDIQNELFC